MAIEGEKSFEPEKVKKALDSVKGYKGLLGTINFTPREPHRDRHRRYRAAPRSASGKDPTGDGHLPRDGQVGGSAMDLDLLVGALTAGSLYALVAMGFNILYRPTNVFNFAQGDLVMLGAMFGATFITLLGLPWFVGAGARDAGGGGAGAGRGEGRRRAGAQPLGDRPRLGDHHARGVDDLRQSGRPRLGARSDRGQAAGAAQHGHLRASGRQRQLLPDRDHGGDRWCWCWASRRSTARAAGKAVLAVAEDRDAALLRGINPNRLSSWSFFLGGGDRGADRRAGRAGALRLDRARPGAAAEGLRRGGGRRHRQQSRRADGGLHHRHRRGDRRPRCCRPATSSR